jgi:hypothetical protein
MADPKKRKADDERVRAQLADYLASVQPQGPGLSQGDVAPLPSQAVKAAHIRAREDNPLRAVWGGPSDFIDAIRTGVGIDPAYQIDTLEARPGEAQVRRTGRYWDGKDPKGMASLQGYPLLDDAGFEEARRQAEANVPAPEPQPIDMKGRLPFISGAPVHKGSSESPMAEPMARAASWSKPIPPSKVEVSVGRPEIVSRKPAPASPQFQARKAGQVDGSGMLSRTLETARRGTIPPDILAMAKKEPEVAAAVLAQDNELTDAQGLAQKGAWNARFARALSMVNEALSGARYDREAYDELEKDAGRPVSDLLQRRSEQRTMDDQSAAASERQRRAAGDERDFLYRSERDKATDAREEARDRANADYRREELRQQGLNRAEARASRLDQRTQNQRDIDERARLARDQKQAATNENDLQELAKRTQTAGSMKDDLATINRYIERGGDLPGVGPFAGRLPELFVSAEGTELRQAATRAVQNLIYQKSGKAVTEQEAQRVMASNGMGTGQSETAFIKGMQALAREMQTALVDAESGFRPEIVHERARRGGTTSAALPAPAATPTGRVKHTQDGQTWAEMDDGTARRIR